MWNFSASSTYAIDYSVKPTKGDTKQILIACEVEQHAKCSHEFTYKGETVTCECECHKTDN